MVDTTDLINIHTSDEANKRLAKRYRFEMVFRLLGISSITLAALALVTLLWSVFEKAVGTLTEHYIALNISLEPSVVDPQGTKDPVEIGQQNVDILWKRALKKVAPYAKTRSQRIALYTLMSDAASLEIREAVKKDISLIGKTRKMYLLADDEVDLYLKGYTGKLTPYKSVGKATPSKEDDSLKVVFESNILNDIIRKVKKTLLEQASLLELQAARQQNAVNVYKSRLEVLKKKINDSTLDDTTLAKVKEDIETETNNLKSAEFQRDRLRKEIKSLRIKASTPGGTFELGTDNISVLIYINGGVIKANQVEPDSLRGKEVIPLKSTDIAAPDKWVIKINERSEATRKFSDEKIVWIEKLKNDGLIKSSLNWRFLTASDSTAPEQAGMWGAVVGSFWTLLVTLIIAFPIGVMAAIYLEEFAPKNSITNFVEVNINNLAAVPSIVFGLLGLGVFLAIAPGYRSYPLIGGMVLALMTLPTIIIAARAAIRAVPPSIREAALGVGASKNQAVFHHVLPLAMPGVLTGTIIGMAQALGETAPLLMIGMYAFVREVPSSMFEPASALPVQIFNWAAKPEVAFGMKTAGAIVVLLVFLIIMNGLAIFLRNKFERKW